MCGICGIIDLQHRTKPAERQASVAQMNARIFHRGPDEGSQESYATSTLAMRRLSIIDLHTGSQPIYNETKTVAVFFNGEIYNYLELLEELQAKGHRFQTKSDTETLVHLYEEYGPSMTQYLRGMYAFCIYDQVRERYFLARDRFGEKPLFYHQKEGVLSFSSELTSLLENRAIPRKLNREAFHYYLRAGIVPEPLTLFADVFCLPAGHQMLLDKQGLQVESYFNIDYRPDTSLKTEADVVDYVKPILEQAVQRQLRSDVPLGAFLSGGIDSSTVVAMMSKFSSSKINTFTVKFEESAYDESPIAREVADFVGSNHHEIMVPNADFSQEMFWRIIEHTGVPFNDTSAIPSYLITQEIRKHVKVALSGDGGDELFAGYPIFRWYGQIHQVKKIPGLIRGAGLGLTNVLRKVPVVNKVGALRQISKALEISFKKSAEIPFSIMELLDKEAFHQLYPSHGMEDLHLLTDFWQVAKDWSPLRQIMYVRLKQNLPLNMLVKVDRMSMANSLEVRAPFLDPDLFEASTRIPDEFLIKNGVGKYIVRAIMREELPDSVFNHPKMGFAIPLHRYQNDDYHALADQLLRRDHPLMELLDEQEIQQIKQVGLISMEDTAQLSVYKASLRLWALIALFGWFDRFEVEL